MNKRTAWRRVARAFEIAAGGGPRSKMARLGLCAATERFDEQTRDAMEADLEEVRILIGRPRYGDRAWWWKDGGWRATHQSDQERSMLAMLLAESSE